MAHKYIGLEALDRTLQKILLKSKILTIGLPILATLKRLFFAFGQLIWGFIIYVPLELDEGEHRNFVTCSQTIKAQRW